MRRAPIGANVKSAHDMGREFKIVSKLNKFYKETPEVILFCEDDTIIGAPFYIMKKVEGIILRAKFANKIDLNPTKWRQLSEKLVDKLAELHKLDIETTGLIELGKPEGYVNRQLEGWIGRYAKSKTEQIAAMETVEMWLLKNQPKTQAQAFLHNDYKYDNIVFDTELNKINAILDWEMATVGDPLMDLGACLAYWCEKEDGDFLKSMNITWFEGNFTKKEVVEHYALKTGFDVSNILFYYVFGLYKNAVIVQQIYARWKAGITSDPRFENLIFGVKELSDQATNAILKKSI